MQMLKGLGPSVAVSKIDLLFLSRIEKRWKIVKGWIFHWAICKDCLVHGRCAIVCITIGSDSKTNLPLIVTIIRRLSLYSAWLRLQEGEEGWRQGGGQIGGFGVRWDAPDLGRGGLGSGKQITSIGSPVPNTAASSLANWQMSATDVLSQFSHLRPCSYHPPHLQGFVEFQMQSLVLVIFVIVAWWRDRKSVV